MKCLFQFLAFGFATIVGQPILFAQNIPDAMQVPSLSANPVASSTNSSTLQPLPTQSAPGSTAPSNQAVDTPLTTETVRGALGNVTRVNARALDNSAGQYWATYDLRPYTQHMKNHPKPEQAVVDWILRETGTDIWFHAPMGIMTIDRDSLHVYHNDGVHQTVKKVYERFVNGTIEPQSFNARIVLIGSPNWRTTTLSWMKAVDPQSPGIQGWLLGKEQTAMLMATLRARTDFAEVAGARLEVTNGQPQYIENLRTVSYARTFQAVQQANGLPMYVPMNDSIREGYQIKLTPLLTPDDKTIDMVVQCSLDQVEKLNPVAVNLPTAVGTMQSLQLSVPQMLSWRLEERFQWPADQTLVLSCGVVAPPADSTRSTILNTQGNSGLFGLGKLVPSAQVNRADALLIIEYNGPVEKSVTDSPTNAAQINAASSNPISRGRY